MVMAMDNYYAQDRLQELWKTINSLHLSYLELEDSPQKLEQRNKLEDCIREYLCLAPHSHKFYFRETAEVLNRSARSKKDFSGYRAALGWQAIGMYAGNLLGQPWRKEYKEIKMYSGFYVHQIDANLVGAEIMFEAMGYKHAGNGIMVLEEPICPDRVTQVSQDSLVAYMECQILKAIWEEVSNTFKISWLEVLEFRERHLCSPKQSIQALIYRFHQRQYEEQNRNYSYNNEPIHGSSRYTPTITTLSNIMPPNHTYSTMPGHSHFPMQMPASSFPPPQYIYGTNGCYSNNYNPYNALAPPPPSYPYAQMSMNYQQPIMKTPYHQNNCSYYNGHVPLQQPNYMMKIPTEQLIEIEPHASHTYDVPDGRIRRTSFPSNLNDIYSKKEDLELKNNNRDTDREEGSGTFESWDYVYRDLESKGYSKDLGERGDVFSPPLGKEKKYNIKEAKKIKSVDLEEGMHNLSISRPLKIDDALEKYRILESNRATKDPIEYRNSDATLSSSYDNISAHDLAAQISQPKATSSKTLPRNRLSEPVPQSSSSKDVYSKTMDVKKSIKKVENSDKLPKISNLKVSNKSGGDKENKEGSKKWECSACTYLNEQDNKICVMCARTKDTVAEEIEVGGAVCPVCTLVNRKDNRACDACGSSLKDSPTYI